MSRAQAEMLYPAATSMAKVFTRDMYEHTAFPTWATEKCGAGAAELPTLDIGGMVSLRNPALILPGLIGTFVGYVGGVWCLTRAKPSVRGDFSWGFALMWFGTSNVVALPLHCWVSHQSELYDELYAANVSFNTCACISAVFALLANCRHLDDGEQETHGTLLSACLFVLIVTSSLVQRARELGPDSTQQMLIELYYFLCILLVVPFMLYRLLFRLRVVAAAAQRKSSGGISGAGVGGWIAVACVSFAAIVSSPLLDAPLCEAVGVLAAPHAGVVAWLAADVAAFALWMSHRAGRAAQAEAGDECLFPISSSIPFPPLVDPPSLVRLRLISLSLSLHQMAHCVKIHAHTSGLSLTSTE